MATRINHLAIASSAYTLEGKFYERIFGLRENTIKGAAFAITVGDGYMGININPRPAGRAAGFDHYGFQVDNLEDTLERMREKYPECRSLKRPSNRPFARLSTHDPDGNMFDLSQSGMEHRSGIYEEGEWDQPRTVSHFGLRTMNPERVAQFYIDVFDLKLLNEPTEDGYRHLSDGRITMVLMPWIIDDFADTGICRPGPDHIGFKVESVDAVKEELEYAATQNPYFRTMPVGVNPEGVARLKLMQKCPFGHFQFADPDGVLLDISE